MQVLELFEAEIRQEKEKREKYAAESKGEEAVRPERKEGSVRESKGKRETIK